MAEYVFCATKSEKDNLCKECGFHIKGGCPSTDHHPHIWLDSASPHGYHCGSSRHDTHQALSYEELTKMKNKCKPGQRKNVLTWIMKHRRER